MAKANTALWVLSGLLLCPSAGSAGPSLPGNPYLEIHERNVFGLKPPPPPHPDPPSAPLPKVMLTGITTILGNKRALLKVEFPSKPPQRAKEQCCILSEGQRDGAIEVLQINEKTESVKLDNSGAVMEITFERPNPTPPPSNVRPPLYPPQPVRQTAAHSRYANQRNYR